MIVSPFGLVGKGLALPSIPQLLSSTEDLANLADWTRLGSVVTTPDVNQPTPNGYANITSIKGAGSAYPYLRSKALALEAGKTYVLSVHTRQLDASYLLIGIYGDATLNIRKRFTWTSGVLAYSGGTADRHDATLGFQAAGVESLGGGLYRPWFRFTPTSSFPLAQAYLYALWNSTALTGSYLWGANFTESAELTPYQPNPVQAPYSVPQDSNLNILLLGDAHMLDTDPVTLSRLQWARDVANAAGADHTIFLGDFVEGNSRAAESQTAAGAIWNAVTVPNHAYLGNRDLIGLTEASWATLLGKSTDVALFGSRFNRAFTLTKGSVSARCLILDDVLEATSTAQAAIRDEIINCTAACFVLFTHTGTSWHSVVDAALTAAARPSLKVHHIYGHHHPWRPTFGAVDPQAPLDEADVGHAYDNHPNALAYLGPGLQDDYLARCVLLSFAADGMMSFKTLRRVGNNAQLFTFS